MSIYLVSESKNHRLSIIHTKEQAHRILVVDKATERRTDAVAQQALSLGTQMFGFLGWNLFVVLSIFFEKRQSGMWRTMKYWFSTCLYMPLQRKMPTVSRDWSLWKTSRIGLSLVDQEVDGGRWERNGEKGGFQQKFKHTR